MRRRRLLALALLTLTVACADSDTGAARGPLAARVACGSGPAAALTAFVLGDLVPQTAPVPADVDPAHWVAARDVVAALRDARLVVLSGAGLEAWATTASLPPSRVLDAAAGTEARWIELPVTRHTHGDGEEHTHSGNDAHVWFDPDLLTHQLERIHDAAVRAFPEQREALDARRAGTKVAVDAYRAELAGLAPLAAGAPLLATWPCYGYLARALGTTVETVSFDPWAADGGPTDAGLRRLEQRARSSAGVLLWPTPPPTELAERLARELGLTSVHVDALLRPSDARRAAPEAAPEDAVARLGAGLAGLRAALEARQK